MTGYTIAGFSLPYVASKEDARQHVADFDRTRIVPGADPRVEWDEHSREQQFYRPEYTEPQWYESAHEAPRSAYILRSAPRGHLRQNVYRSDGARLRYVPLDVCRWRDPEHRLALTARARAHAALVPGNRATMEVER